MRAPTLGGQAIELCRTEVALSLPQKNLKLLLELATSGTVGLALLLGAAPPATAAPEPTSAPAAAQRERVSERLAAIREAVSEITGAEAQTPDSLGQLRLAWHNWGNGGWHRPWGNWGWARPWGNYGYRPWNNWNNWRNGWNNWRNGWGNWR